MNKNNDAELALAVRHLQGLAGDLDKAMREDRDMISYAAKMEQAAREIGWKALNHYMKKLEVV